MTRALLGVCLIFACGQTQACDLDDAIRIELDDALSLFYRVRQPPLRVARHFTLQFQFCRDDQPVQIDRFKLDASMPEHGHGMNYRASILPLNEGAFEARGLMFHMPGKWQIELQYWLQGEAEQLSLDYVL